MAINKKGLSQKPARIAMITARQRVALRVDTLWRFMVLGSLNHLECLFIEKSQFCYK